MVILLAASACLFAGSALSDALMQRSIYVKEQYTAYAMAQETAPGTLSVEVFLQRMPDAEAPGIRAYAVYAGDAAPVMAEPAAADAAEAQPTHFAATLAAEGTLDALRLVPVAADGTEMEAAAIDLPRAAAEGSHVGTEAAVNNPDPNDRLNLRLGPSGTAQSLRHYYNGVRVNVLDALSDGWVAVSIGSPGGMARGYMKADFLAFGDAASQVTSVIPAYTASVASWTLYSLPDEGSAPIATYGEGQAFELLGESSAWWHIRVGDSTGFVRADVLTHAEAPEAGTAEAEAPEAASPATKEPAEEKAPRPAKDERGAEEGGLRAYRAEHSVSRRYTITAAVKESAAGQFQVAIMVQRSGHDPDGDTIASYWLYVNGEKLANIPLNPQGSDAAQNMQRFEADVAIEGTISAMRVVPEWTDGGEREEGAIAFGI